MPLAAGIRVGPYETVALFGACGMGEVYRRATASSASFDVVEDLCEVKEQRPLVSG